MVSLRIPVLPNVYHPRDTPVHSFGACHMENMNKEQMANWVWTFCHSKGWPEGKSYAEKFRDHEITGYATIERLDMNMLKFLGIGNREHREQLMDAINCLRPERLLT